MNRIALLRQYAPELQVCDKSISINELAENDEHLMDFCKILRLARTSVEKCNNQNKNNGKKGKKTN